MQKIISELFSNRIIQTLIVILFAWVLFELKYIILILLLAFIVMSGMKPLVRLLHIQGAPKPFAVGIPYLTLVGLIVLLSYGMWPAVSTQLSDFASNFPNYIEQALDYFRAGELEFSDSVVSAISNFISGGVSALLSLPQRMFIILIALVAVIALSIYLLWYPEYLSTRVERLGGATYRNVLPKIEHSMGMWIRGQLIISFAVGILTWLGLRLLGVESALTLALIAAVLEFIPYIGPTAAGLIAVIVVLPQSAFLAILVILLYVVIQIVESNILVPQVMKRMVNLHPITIIVGILIGGHFLGILGAVVTVPIMSIFTLIYKEIDLKNA